MNVSLVPVRFPRWLLTTNMAIFQESEFSRSEPLKAIANEVSRINHHIKLTCLLAGFFERIHENRKKYTESEGESNRYDHANCRTETNKPRPNTVLIVRRHFIAVKSHVSNFHFLLHQSGTFIKKFSASRVYISDHQTIWCLCSSPWRHFAVNCVTDEANASLYYIFPSRLKRFLKFIFNKFIWMGLECTRRTSQVRVNSLIFFSVFFSITVMTWEQ